MTKGRSPENMAATDLQAAAGRFATRGTLVECEVETLRSELVEAMATMCEEFGLLDLANGLRRAVAVEFNRPEDMEDA